MGEKGGRRGRVGSRLIVGERKGEVGKRKRLKVGGEREMVVLLTRQSLVESSERNVKC